jgi:hypothetical protein
MSTNRYGLYPAILDDVNLIQLSRIALSPGIARRIIEMGGNIHTKCIAHQKQQISLTLATTELKRVLDKFATPWQGLRISSASPATSPLVIYLQRRLDSGGRSTGDDFIKISFADGLLVPRTLVADDNGEAALILEFFPIAPDGQADPYSISSAGSNPTIAQTPDLYQLWTAGPVKINAPTLEADKYQHVQSTTVDFGIQVDLVSGDGNFYNLYAGIQSAHPSIALALGDAKALVDIDLGGAVQGANDSTVFFTKMVDGGGRVARATATHCSIAVAAGTIIPTNLTVDGVAAAISGLMITPAYNESDVQMNISTATAIT